MNQRFLKKFEELSKGDWYHRIDFGDGHVTKSVHSADPYDGLDRWPFIREHIPSLKGKRVLDLGCATGLYSMQAAREGADSVLGLDRAAGSIERALFVRDVFGDIDAVDYSEQVTFNRCDFVATPIRDLGEFDVCFLFRVLYHTIRSGAAKLLGQLRDMVETLAVQGSYTGAHFGCSPRDIVTMLHRYGFTDITLYNTTYPDGRLYDHFLVIGKA